MPRLPRVSPPGVPLHVIQRGNNRQDCFVDSSDYSQYLNALTYWSRRYAVQVHAYALMTNHVHLLVTPLRDHGASKLMMQLGRQYVLYFNKRYGRTGTLWDGRFRSEVVDTDRYVLACYRYVEMNPVRAGLVEKPGEYRWSSYRTNALGRYSELIDPHDLWLRLGPNDAERQSAYRRLFTTDNLTGSEPFQSGL